MAWRTREIKGRLSLEQNIGEGYYAFVYASSHDDAELLSQKFLDADYRRSKEAFDRMCKEYN